MVLMCWLCDNVIRGANEFPAGCFLYVGADPLPRIYSVCLNNAFKGCAEEIKFSH